MKSRKVKSTKAVKLSWNTELLLYTLHGEADEFLQFFTPRKLTWVTYNYCTDVLFLLGIFFKYDMSSIMVRVESRHRSFWGFLVRLCGIVGGMFATSGKILKSFFSHLGSLWATMPCFKILLKVLYSCWLQYYFLMFRLKQVLYLLSVKCLL